MEGDNQLSLETQPLLPSEFFQKQVEDLITKPRLASKFGTLDPFGAARLGFALKRADNKRHRGVERFRCEQEIAGDLDEPSVPNQRLQRLAERIDLQASLKRQIAGANAGYAAPGNAKNHLLAKRGGLQVLQPPLAFCFSKPRQGMRIEHAAAADCHRR
jgi:hypothetical protein